MKRLTPALLAVCLACSFSASLHAADTLQTRSFNNMPADFIKGADISTLLDAEKHGAKFYNHSNQLQDPIAILKADGVNYVRLRLWVGLLLSVEVLQIAVGLWQARSGLPIALVNIHMVLAVALVAAMTAVIMNLKAPAAVADLEAAPSSTPVHA